MKIRLSQLAEWWYEETRRHHDKLRDAAAKRLADSLIDEELQRSILTDMKREHDAVLESTTRRAAALAARGMRMDDEPIH